LNGLRALLSAALLLVLPSCGPVVYSVVIVKAGSAFKSAEAAGAAEHAPYYYYRAQAYLEKAREEAGYSDFQPALRYGRIALQSSREALKISSAQEQRRGPNASAPTK
jgi:Domain of unknown function (DUF4398)